MPFVEHWALKGLYRCICFVQKESNILRAEFWIHKIVNHWSEQLKFAESLTQIISFNPLNKPGGEGINIPTLGKRALVQEVK